MSALRSPEESEESETSEDRLKQLQALARAFDETTRDMQRMEETLERVIRDKKNTKVLFDAYSKDPTVTQKLLERRLLTGDLLDFDKVATIAPRMNEQLAKADTKMASGGAEEEERKVTKADPISIHTQLAKARASLSTKDRRHLDRALWDECHLPRKGNQNKLRDLLDKGADAACSHPGSSGSTALHEAAANGYGTIISMLLEAGAKIDAQDSNGLTPLHIASRNGREVVVGALLKGGANVVLKDNMGMAASDWAHTRNHTAIWSLLLHAKAKGGGKSTVQ